MIRSYQWIVFEDAYLALAALSPRRTRLFVDHFAQLARHPFKLPTSTCSTPDDGDFSVLEIPNGAILYRVDHAARQVLILNIESTA